MSRFSVWQRVRLIRVDDPFDPLADDWDTVGDEGIVVSAMGFYPADRPVSHGYDCVCVFPSYGEYCAWDWQLEPIMKQNQPCDVDFKLSLEHILEAVRA